MHSRPHSSYADLTGHEQRQEDEAATPEGIAMRMKEAGAFFMVREEGGKVVGFVNGTLSRSAELTHSSMGKHEPDVSGTHGQRELMTLHSSVCALSACGAYEQGSTLCIHSVVTREDRRRQGLVIPLEHGS
jgi:hypothetical protein